MSNFIFNFLNNCTPPCRCVLCAASCKNSALCPDCLSHLPYLTQALCPQCALPAHDGCLCAACLNHPPAFDFSFAAFTYTPPITQLIIAAKFSGHWSLLPTLGQLLLDQVSAAPRPHFIIPLPLHPKRLKERGYNQAFELAKPITRQLQLDLRPDLLERRINTEHQARLSQAERHKNMQKAFYTRHNLDGKHVVLIDDVMTSGSSLHAAAACLKKAGAARVDNWVLARAI
ncbi:ComF family protein [Iodobacter fluviatilis]|uniref:ComF family protein n=1 Tax=Iodobacter fluviatilis TaxID=537 RepID=A0A377Q7V6_9NEIS|nr:ComF family protein [Iodobacter fluviatilis]STQ90825.1 DNA utilization protein GntX [Iodobacter fluviatilis]